MDRYTEATEAANNSPPSEAWLFAQALLGRPIPRLVSPATRAKAHRAQLEWLAQISTRHEQELRELQAAERKAQHGREILKWAAQISTEAEKKLRAIEQAEARERRAWQAAEQFARAQALVEWDEADHPRAAKGTSIGGQWVGKGGGAVGASKSPSIFDLIIQRSRTVAELTGVVTPSMIRSTQVATALQSAVKLPDEVARAAAAGLITGEKAVVNGFATAAKDVATLGLSPGQLELIGVSKEDRERGYNTAVAISTGSGQVLIAVGTGGIGSALSKGGSVARAANGALIAYDAAGNAVGVVQGVHDAANNGINIANGAQVAASALGISGNLNAAKGLIKSRPAAPSSDVPASPTPSPAPAASATEFRVGKHGDMPSPRPGQHSHHGVMSAWMQRVFPGYDATKAPAVLMPDINHHATYSVFNRWRAEMTQRLGGTFDWSRISEPDMRTLSEKMFDAAEVPSHVRQQYWKEFEEMKGALRRQRPPRTLEGQRMGTPLDILNAEQMRRLYGNFYNQTSVRHLDRKNVPEKLWPLLPYAAFWGISDDWTREDLFEAAPVQVTDNLKTVVACFDADLDEWLAGPEADNPRLSDEYIAFTAMRMAADLV
jgi:hypothetical protein